MVIDSTAVRERLQEMLCDLDIQAAKLAMGADREMNLSDAGAVLTNNDRERALLEGILEQKTRVAAALSRLEAGTYGRCIDCGVDLPDARLEVRPEAARCVKCQAKIER
jgi:DnaK suppressor protein